MRRSLFVAASGVLWLTCPRAARAAGDDRAVAETLFQKGRAALVANDLQTACAAFEESARLEAAPGTMYNLADCEERRGHLSNAWQWFGETLAKLPDKDDRRPLVERRLRALKARLPFLTVRVAPDAPPGTKVTADSIELRSASFGVALPVDPGRHHVVASATGHADAAFDVDVREGDQKDLTVSPGPASEIVDVTPLAPAVAARRPENPSPMQEESAAPHDTKMLGYVLGGVGVAGIGTALVLGAVAIGKNSTVKNDCVPSALTCNTQSGIDASNSGRTISTISTVSFVVGLAALGAGAYFVLSSPKEKKTVLRATPMLGGGFMTLVREF